MGSVDVASLPSRFRAGYLKTGTGKAAASHARYASR